MTALLNRPAAAATAIPIWTVGAPRLLAGLSDDVAARPLDLAAHLAAHGPMPAAELPALLTMLDAAGLAGRGGAGFPLATKLRSVATGRRRVIVNGAEGEPSSLKDRLLLRRTPHLVLDGALAVAAALGTRDVTVAVHDAQAAVAVRNAIAQRPDGRRMSVRVLTGGFVAGEARALIRQLDGGPALPPGRRTLPTANGDVLSNVETFAQVAVLVRLGSWRFAEAGTTAEPGTALLTVSGAVDRPGVVEVPLGLPLGILLTAAGARDPQAVVVGGYHGSWIAPNPHLPLSRDGLKHAGGSFGAGVVIAVDGSTCALGELGRVATWLAGESVKQCGPCTFGLPALAHDLAALAAGHPAALTSAFAHTRAVDRRGACAHPDGAVRFVTSGLHLLQAEVEQHRQHGSCGRPVLGRLPLGTVTP